jgi:elongation factor P
MGREVYMITASQLRAGMAFKYQGQDYRTVTAEYHPGQGKMGGVTHVRLQNLATGTFWETSFRSDLKVEDMPVERQLLEFLYVDGDQCFFMNPETYEQIEIAKANVGPLAGFLEAGKSVSVDFVEGRPVSVLFPDVLEVRIADTAPPLHQQQDSTFKPAKLANGVEVMVPQFIKTGDAIRLDLRTLKYMDRVKSVNR